jgi:hypothetical protein
MGESGRSKRMAWEYCTVNGAISRTTNLLDLTLEYRNVPDKNAEKYASLPRVELESALRRLRADGWELESQCANPTTDWYTETYTFKRQQTEI